jgi:hypothetical protein
MIENVLLVAAVIVAVGFALTQSPVDYVKKRMTPTSARKSRRLIYLFSALSLASLGFYFLDPLFDSWFAILFAFACFHQFQVLGFQSILTENNPQTPTPSVKGKPKLFLWLFFVVLALVGIVIMVSKLQATIRAGKEFGATHTKHECIEDTLSRYTTKSGAGDQLFNSFYLSACLDHGQGNNDFCTTITSEEQLCGSRNNSPLHCRTVFNGMKAYCESR